MPNETDAERLIREARSLVGLIVFNDALAREQAAIKERDANQARWQTAVECVNEYRERAWKAEDANVKLTEENRVLRERIVFLRNRLDDQATIHFKDPSHGTEDKRQKLAREALIADAADAAQEPTMTTIDLDKRADSILSTPMAERAVMVAEDPSVLDVVKQALDAKDDKLRAVVEALVKADELLREHMRQCVNGGPESCYICGESDKWTDQYEMTIRDATLSAPTGDKVK